MRYSPLRFFRNLRLLAKIDLREWMKNENAHTQKMLQNLPEKLRDEIKSDFESITPPRVMDSFETLNELLKTNKSFIRFGDGEYLIINGDGIRFQKYNKQLAATLLEILTSRDDNLLIGLGYEYFHAPTDAWRGLVREFAYTFVLQKYDEIKKYIQPGRSYGATTISQVYATYAQYDFERHYALMRELFCGKKVVVVCGDKVFSNIKYNIFEDAGAVSLEYVYGPTNHAYSAIDSLRAQLLEFEKDHLFVFALGPAGKALAYELHQSGRRCLDLGHAIKDYDCYKRGAFHEKAKEKDNIAKFFAPDA